VKLIIGADEIEEALLVDAFDENMSVDELSGI
jgi:hypothetical protein